MIAYLWDKPAGELGRIQRDTETGALVVGGICDVGNNHEMLCWFLPRRLRHTVARNNDWTNFQRLQRHVDVACVYLHVARYIINTCVVALRFTVCTNTLLLSSLTVVPSGTWSGLSVKVYDLGLTYSAVCSRSRCGTGTSCYRFELEVWSLQVNSHNDHVLLLVQP